MRPALFLIALSLAAQYPPTSDQRREIEQKSAELDAALRPLRARVPDDLLADAEIYLKAARWILRYDEFYGKDYAARTLAVLDTGLERARELAAGKPQWPAATGCLSRAYRSRVDGSVQPYALTIPPNYTSASPPQWLEVVLHGRGATLNEVSFLYAHDRAKPAAADHDFIQLDIFGRGNNAYRWAGEADVFEAIESVKKRYRIDPVRIVLRGFSMGGAGAWHIGLHHPDEWAAVEAGAGFVDTKVYAKIENPPPYVHIYDAIDYALNAVDVPIVGYAGEEDPKADQTASMREALEREGYHFQKDGLNYKTEDLRALFLVGPKTPHRWHPESKKESNVFVLLNQSGAIREPSEVRFVTYTERYNRCFWLAVDQLERQYERAQVDGELLDHEITATTHNVARLTLRGEAPPKSCKIDGQELPTIDSPTTFERVNGRWRTARRTTTPGKVHGLQGPIDDAFMDAFLCVRPVGQVHGLPSQRAGRGPAPLVNDFALQRLDQFAKEFPRWMRGDIRQKADTAVTATDERAYNIVVFGTPATNPLIARALRAAPIRWTADAIIAGNRKFSAATHLLSMIYPNPANPHRYIVINSGHTFHEADFKGTNALLYPRAGDWYVTDIRTGEIVAEGVFDRNWR